MNHTNYTPVNRVAALVVSNGVHFNYKKKRNTVESNIYLETKKIPRCERTAHGFIDLTGFTFGRFTVIGKYKHGKGWVVRCSCGTYCVRTAKAIKNKNNAMDRCEECRHLEYIQKLKSINKEGK